MIPGGMMSMFGLEGVTRTIRVAKGLSDAVRHTLPTAREATPAMHEQVAAAVRSQATVAGESIGDGARRGAAAIHRHADGALTRIEQQVDPTGGVRTRHVEPQEQARLGATFAARVDEHRLEQRATEIRREMQAQAGQLDQVRSLAGMEAERLLQTIQDRQVRLRGELGDIVERIGPAAGEPPPEVVRHVPASGAGDVPATGALPGSPPSTYVAPDAAPPTATEPPITAAVDRLSRHLPD